MAEAGRAGRGAGRALLGVEGPGRLQLHAGQGGLVHHGRRVRRAGAGAGAGPPLPGAGHLHRPHPGPGTGRRVVRGVRVAQDEGRRPGRPHHRFAARPPGRHRRYDPPEGHRGRGPATAGRVPVLPLAPGVPGGLRGPGGRGSAWCGSVDGVAGRVQLCAGESAVGAGQASGAGVLRHPRREDRQGRQQGRTREADRRARRQRRRDGPGAAHRVHRRPPPVRGRQPSTARLGPLPADGPG